MPDIKYTYVRENEAHDTEIDEINAEAFGPGRFARAAQRIREQGGHDRNCSFVALEDGAVIGSVRMTPVTAGEGRAMLLGPLAVRPDHKNLGIGRKLMDLAIDAARQAHATPAVILVGDLPYYARAGFVRAGHGKVTFPGPVDPKRILVLSLCDGAADRLQGLVTHAALAPVS